MRKKESGATIVVVISVIATLAMFIGAALDYTFTVARNVERSDKMGQAAAIANGCLQDQFMYWREICR
jgi:type II secretory pathway component PulK